jgi:hypothetical protein
MHKRLLAAFSCRDTVGRMQLACSFSNRFFCDVFFAFDFVYVPLMESADGWVG